MMENETVSDLVDQILFHKKKYYDGEPVISDEAYDAMLKTLEKNGVDYIFDKYGAREEVYLIDDKPTELSTNRVIIPMRDVKKQRKRDYESVWGKLMFQGNLVCQQDNLCFFTYPDSPGYIIYDSSINQIIGTLPDLPTNDDITNK